MRSLFLTSALLTAALAANAHAMTRPGVAPGFAARAAAVDPDKRLSRLAAAASAGDRSHGKPPRSARTILKDDPYLRAAFASLDNK